MFTILVSNETSVAIPEILTSKPLLLTNGKALLVFSKCFCPNHEHFALKVLQLGGLRPPSPPPPRIVRLWLRGLPLDDYESNETESEQYSMVLLIVISVGALSRLIIF